MELHLIARFHVRAGEQAAAEAALSQVAAASCRESGCLAFRVFRALGDPALFFIHSKWRDEAAFAIHADLPHTARYIETIERLSDQPSEITRTEQLI
jgi:quinol monooxygenase YgiN